MEIEIKKFECPAPCNFSVTSDNEIVEIAIQHAKKSHNQVISGEYAKKMITTA